MKPKNKIIRLRERNPLLPSNQIAKAVGVSRQWVSYVLNRAGLVTAAPRQKAISTCMKCGVTILPRNVSVQKIVIMNTIILK